AGPGIHGPMAKRSQSHRDRRSRHASTCQPHPGYANVECGYFRALPSYIAARSFYPRVNVPVTLVYVDHDWSKPQERDQVAELVQGSLKITLAQSGHFGSLEHPNEIASTLIEAAGQ